MDRPPRLKSEIRLAAIMRQASAVGVSAVIARKGDPDAGMIAIKVYLGRESGTGLARLIMETREGIGDSAWRDQFDSPQAEHIVDERLAREAKFDRDLWVVEIEDKAGRSFTD